MISELATIRDCAAELEHLLQTGRAERGDGNGVSFALGNAADMRIAAAQIVAALRVVEGGVHLTREEAEWVRGVVSGRYGTREAVVKALDILDDAARLSGVAG